MALIATLRSSSSQRLTQTQNRLESEIHTPLLRGGEVDDVITEERDIDRTRLLDQDSR